MVPKHTGCSSQLHFNENSGREEAVTREGKQSYEIVYPKYKKGGYVVRKITVGPTYSKFSLVLLRCTYNFLCIYLQSTLVTLLLRR